VGRCLAGEGAALECGRREKEGLGKGSGGGAWLVRVQRWSAGSVRRKDWEGELGRAWLVSLQRRSAGGVRRKDWEGELGSGLESILKCLRAG